MAIEAAAADPMAPINPAITHSSMFSAVSVPVAEIPSNLPRRIAPVNVSPTPRSSRRVSGKFSVHCCISRNDNKDRNDNEKRK